LSLGEDAAVVTGALLSFYAPWVMLGIVILFVLLFALIGPRLLRTLSFNIRMVGAFFTWLWRTIRRARRPASLPESLLEMPPERLRSLNALLAPGEELLGALQGWKRSSRGPRRASLLLTSRRLLWIEHRLFRKPQVGEIDYRNLSLARFRNLVLFVKFDFLTRQNESHTLNLRKTHAAFGEMGVERIRELAGLPREAGGTAPAAESNLASVPR
jgi:hypothetical protein